jgi:hypothetical protein
MSSFCNDEGKREGFESLIYPTRDFFSYFDKRNYSWQDIPILPENKKELTTTTQNPDKYPGIAVICRVRLNLRRTLIPVKRRILPARGYGSI